MWQIKAKSKASAQQNMQWDYEDLLNMTPQSLPSMRFYAWQQNCATYGYFLQPYDFIDINSLIHNNLELARRPTGGGILFHLTDLAFSIVVPASHPFYSSNTLNNYAAINHRVLQAIEAFSGRRFQPELLQKETTAHVDFCMAKSTKYDVLIEGKKLCGAAQRRTKQGLLHQGSISICLPPLSLLESVLKPETKVLEAIKNNSFCLFPDATLKEIEEIRAELKDYLIDFICK